MARVLLFIFCLNGLVVKGQEVSWSTPVKGTDKVIFIETLGSNGNGIYLVKKPEGATRNISLERYDAGMRLSKSKALFAKKDEYYAQAVLTGTEIQLYWVLHDRTKKEIEVYVRALDFDLDDKSEDSLLFSFPDGEYNEKYLQVYKPRMAPHVLFIYTNQSIEIPSQFHYYVMDTTRMRLHSGIFNIDIPTKYDIEEAVFIGDRVAMLVEQEIKKKLGKEEYQYVVWHGKVGDDALSPVKFYDDSVTVTDGKLRADYANGNIVFAGLYEMKDSGFAKGTVIWNLNTTEPSRGTLQKRSFSASVIADMAGKNARTFGLHNLRVGDVFLRKDGGLILTCEEYRETREAVADMAMYGISQNNFRYYYYFENILAMSINPDGSMHWHSVLRKDQVSVNDDGMFSSYAAAIMGDRIVYLYNDLSRKTWNLSLLEVRADGSSRTDILIRAQEYDARLMPQYGSQSSYNELIIPAVEKRGQILMKVKF
jgi:hypothetical protein